MSNTLPPSLPKMPVVVGVVDSSLAPTYWARIVRCYFPHLFACLAEGNPLPCNSVSDIVIEYTYSDDLATPFRVRHLRTPSR